MTINGKLYHGNYENAKCDVAARKYAEKGGVYISTFDLDAKAKKKAARNHELLTGDLKQMVDKGIIGLTQLAAIEKGRALYQSLTPPVDADGVRGVWVVGETGVGKSHFVRTQYAAKDLYLKGINKWWCGYTGQKAVLIDDLDFHGATVEFGHYLKRWTDKWSDSVEIKGGRVNLHHEVVYVTSQYEIKELWPGEQHERLRDALERRFTRIELHRRMDPKDIEDLLGEDN